MQVVYTHKEFKASNKVSAVILSHLGMETVASQLRDMNLMELEEQSTLIKVTESLVIIEVPEAKMIEILAVMTKHANKIAPIVSAIVSLLKAFKGLLKDMSDEFNSVKLD